MDIVIGFILAVCTAATLVAIFTGWAFWIGLGLLAICLLSIWQEKRIDDPSGDGGIAMFFGIIAPSGIAALVFLLADGIKFLITR